MDKHARCIRCRTWFKVPDYVGYDGSHYCPECRRQLHNEWWNSKTNSEKKQILDARVVFRYQVFFIFFLCFDIIYFFSDSLFRIEDPKLGIIVVFVVAWIGFKIIKKNYGVGAIWKKLFSASGGVLLLMLLKNVIEYQSIVGIIAHLPQFFITFLIVGFLLLRFFPNGNIRH